MTQKNTVLIYFEAEERNLHKMRKGGKNVHFFDPTEKWDIDQRSCVCTLVEKGSYDPRTFYPLLQIVHYGIFFKITDHSKFRLEDSKFRVDKI
jgi:hypothetical protein